MLIDLSVRLYNDTPAYPGDPHIDIKPSAQHEQGYTDHQITLGTHTGTHIDAPAHMIRGAQTLDQFPLETFVGRAKCIDVRSGFTLAIVESADVQQGDIVLLCTGMSASYYEPEYFTDYPAMSVEIAEYLVQNQVKMVGVDTCSVDNDSTFPIHKILLGHDILAIENLTNLEQLVGKTCTLTALPLNLALDGAPARVIAEV